MLSGTYIALNVEDDKVLSSTLRLASFANRDRLAAIKEESMSQALYLKWRPQTFEDVIGQAPIVRTLRNALRHDHVHHAYLFAGPRGTGKTTTARLIAKAVNCIAPREERPCNSCELCQAINEGRLMDLVEIDAASHTGVDNIRDILEKVQFRPTQARYKVYVVDEVHMLSTAAFNALLKTLEEPPEHVIFVLATTEIHKIPPTVLSRCQRFEFRRIPLREIIERLRMISDAENIEVESEALDLIARAATGSMRDAISLLDQMAAGGTVSADYVRQMLGSERRSVVQALARAWLDEGLSEGVAVINQAVDGGADPRQLARQTADFLRGLMLMRLGAGETWTEPTAEERPGFMEMAQQADAGQLVRAVHLFSEAASESQAGWQPQLPLELAFVEATLKPTAVTAPAAAQPAQSEQSERQRQKTSRTPSRSQSQSQSKARAKATPRPQRPPAKAGSIPPVQKIQARWKEALRQLSPPDAAPLWPAKPLDVDSQGQLVLGFTHTFHRNKAKEGADQRLEEVLTRMFGRQIRVRCVMKEEWSSAGASAPAKSPPPAQPSPKPQDAENDKEEAPAPDAEKSQVQDAVARRAVEELGAVAEEIDPD
jgi:DNA polymerase-3 subunit gamma/tau